VFGRRRASISHRLPQLLSATFVVALSGTFGLAQVDRGALISAQVTELQAQLSQPGEDQTRLDHAARRLLEIGGADASLSIRSALTDPGNGGARLAAVRALADLPDRADVSMVDPLFVLLAPDTSRTLADAAVDALSRLRSLPDVTTRLIALTTPDRSEAVRQLAIRALSSHADRKVADVLVALLQDREPSIGEAAHVALTRLAGIDRDGPAGWKAWLDERATLSDADFRIALLEAQSAQLQSRLRRSQADRQLLQRMVEAEFAAATKDQRPAFLERYLSSANPTMRVIGADFALEFAKTLDLPPTIVPLLRDHLTDTEPDVRLRSAQTIALLKDPSAFGPLSRQIVVERDPTVKAALIEAVAPTRDAQALPLLRAMLDDAASGVVIAAANGIAELAPVVVADNPLVAAEYAAKLQEIVAARFQPGNGSASRQAALAAMIEFRQRPLSRYLVELSTSRRGGSFVEPAPIRRLAVRGLGRIGIPENADNIVEAMSDESSIVRLEALESLAQTARDFTYAEAIFRLTDVAAEPRERDPAINDRAWQTLKQMFDVAPYATLSAWPERVKADPTKRLDVLIALERLADRDAVTTARIYHLQQIGDTQVELNKPVDAATSFRSALNLLSRQPNPPGQVLVSLNESLLRAYLASRQYESGTQFSSELLEQSRENQGIVGPLLTNECETLAKTNGRLDDARRLIDASLAISKLDPQFAGQLRELRTEVARRLDEQNDRLDRSLYPAVADAR
jgi:HEAT repeat protein